MLMTVYVILLILETNAFVEQRSALLVSRRHNLSVHNFMLPMMDRAV